MYGRPVGAVLVDKIVAVVNSQILIMQDFDDHAPYGAWSTLPDLPRDPEPVEGFSEVGRFSARAEPARLPPDRSQLRDPLRLVAGLCETLGLGAGRVRAPGTRLPRGSGPQARPCRRWWSTASAWCTDTVRWYDGVARTPRSRHALTDHEATCPLHQSPPLLSPTAPWILHAGVGDARAPQPRLTLRGNPDDRCSRCRLTNRPEAVRNVGSISLTLMPPIDSRLCNALSIKSGCGKKLYGHTLYRWMQPRSANLYRCQSSRYSYGKS